MDKIVVDSSVVAMYLALSQREQCPFVTADEKLVNAVSPNFPGVVWVANVSSVMP